MKALWFIPLVAILGLGPPLRADEPKKVEAKETYQIPYRLTDTKHILVRAKINGKGPYNFIVDTGAPALFVGTELCKKLGIEPDRKGWGTFDRFEIEGGAVIPKARGRIEDPFQLEGMNGLGLAGVHLHGIIGYNVLARYKLEFDFTKDKMTWTKLDFEPPPPEGLGGKGGAAGGLDVLGTLMKLAGALLGKSPQPDVTLRGFLGAELGDSDDGVEVKSVLAKGPAALAGLKAGDRITRIQGKVVASLDAFNRLAEKFSAGQNLRLTLSRGKETQQVTVTIGKGL